MLVDYDVPFYANTPDDTHCAQATYRMIRQYFEPSFAMSWHELDQHTGKTDLYATWYATALLWMEAEGYEVRRIDSFDFARFAAEGLPYLYEFYGPHTAGWLKEVLDMPTERARSAVLAQHHGLEVRIPTQVDVEAYLDAGWLVQVTVNLKRLNGEYGYLGHAVVMKGYDGGHFLIHDPGLPPRPNRLVTRDEFEQAWANPSANAKHINAFRKL